MRKIIPLFVVVLFFILVLLFFSRNSNLFKKEVKEKKILSYTPIKNGQVVLAAGDIAECTEKNNVASETAKLLDRYPGTVLALGDNIDEDIKEDGYGMCFDPVWGRHKKRIFPTFGNHDNWFPYIKYFSKKASGDTGMGYYSFNLGSWHLISVNTQILGTPCAIGVGDKDSCNRYSDHLAWLRKDLEKNKTDCTLVFGHFPMFSSGRAGDSLTPDFGKLVYSKHVDLILSGHDHHYERFAPMDPKRNRDLKRGIRQFVVGTGGALLTGYKNVSKNSEVIKGDKFGILKLILGKGEYEWEFISTDGSFVDKGKGNCH